MEVKITRTVNVDLPQLVRCQMTGYLDRMESGYRVGKGSKFCTVGAYYELYEIRTDDDNEATFVIRTETVGFDGKVTYTRHEMDFDFMAKYFDVPF